MKNKEKIMQFALLLFISTFNTRIMAKEPNDTDALVAKLRSEDRLVRCDAISQMTETVVGRGRQIYVEYSTDKRIRAALIDLFAKESKKKIKGEGAAACHSDLASLVASLKDADAVPLLLNNIVNSDVEYFLAETRDSRIMQQMIKNFYQERDYPGKREIALKIMSRMYKLGVLADEDRERTRTMLREAIDENECYFKITAVRAIVEMDDEDAMPELERIAKTDNCASRNNKNGKIVIRYREREEAQKALGIMRARHKGKLQQGLPTGATRQTNTQ